MLKKRTKYKYNTGILILSTIIAIVCILNYTNKKEKPSIPTYSIQGSYLVDVNNPKEVVGDADYVFLGNVVEQTGTLYKNKIPMEQENGDVLYIGNAYTNYTVSVIENIKNELVTSENISISKLGGIREDSSAYDIFEDDFLPEVGKTYIFIAYAQEDGSLLVAGPNSNILCTNKSLMKSKSSFLKTSEYTTYKTAVDNQITTNRKSEVSIYKKEH